MAWNWQQRDWPHFRFERQAFDAFEREFTLLTGETMGVMQHLDEAERSAIRVDILRDEAYLSSKVEGELLNRESLQSSIRKGLGLPDASESRVRPAEWGMAKVMVDLALSHDQPLSQEQLLRWHAQLMNGRQDLQSLGRYREHPDPMHIVSGPMGYERVHFEAPPSHKVPAMMDAFVKQFNGQASAFPGSALVSAGLMHLHFESIHPFEDGNGRIGRVLVEKHLGQTLKRPILLAWSQSIDRDKQAYYKGLQSASRSLDADDWLHYFCRSVLEAQKRTMSHVHFILAKSRFFLRHDSRLNDRQRKVLKRMFQAGPDGFTGGLSAANYIAIAKTSASTATRDLSELAAWGALSVRGERRHTRYFLRL